MSDVSASHQVVDQLRHQVQGTPAHVRREARRGQCPQIQESLADDILCAPIIKASFKASFKGGV